MNLSEICIKRPVLATVLSLILVAIGIMGLKYLDTRFLPKFEQNTIQVNTTYAGASSQLVETSITTPLEEAISGIQGVDSITSQSYQSYSSIKITLKTDFNVYEVSNQVRDKVQQARKSLPDNADSPIVQSGHSQANLMIVGFVDKSMSLNMIRDYLNRYVIDKVEQSPGIANVEVVGADPYALRIRVNPEKMAARNLTVTDVQAAVANSNIELPAGEIKSSSINFPINAKTKLTNLAEFNNIIVKNDNGNIIRVKDIGQAELSSDSNDESIVRINGQPGVLLSIYNADDANPIDAANHVNTLLNSLQHQLPSDMRVVRAYDQSNFMKASVREVYESILIAILCVILVIFLFLGNLRTVLIPVVTIPICLLASFGVMYFFGFSINLITLLALVLSIGLVVDDAIVMLENIYRHIEAGEKPLTAALKGTKEISFAVIAMTLTLAAVYAPVGLVHGRIADVFRPFAFTLAGAVILSGFVALTLSPMMCSRLLRTQSQSLTTGYSQFIERLFDKMSAGYAHLLQHILKFRRWVIAATLIIAVGGFFLVKSIPFTFMPSEDIGFVVAGVNAPSGSSIGFIADQTNKVGDIVAKSPEVKYRVSIADTNAKSFNVTFATLNDFKQRNQSAQQIANQINADIRQVPGLDASAYPPSFGGSMQHQLEFSIMASGSYEDLYHTSQQLIKTLSQYPGLTNLQSTMKFDSQQYDMTVNRDLAGRLQVSIKDIDNTMAALLSGTKVSTFDIDGKNYNVYLQAPKEDLSSLSSTNKFYVKNAVNALIPLSNLVQFKSVLAQTVLPHYDRLRSATISAQLSPGYNIGQVVSHLNTELPNILPSNVKYAFTGQAKNVAESSNSMGLLFILALVFIYLVLAAQFESFIDPLIILLAVPLSVVGALASLKLIHGSMNLYTIIGLVTLVGLIAKHGILITQFANTLRDQGYSLHNALVKAAQVRLRPILMTTAAMIFGALPLILAVGASAVSRQQIGMVLIGGLLFGTFFSLVLVPVTYSYAGSLKQRLGKKKQSA